MIRRIAIAVAAMTIGWMAPIASARAATVTPPPPKAVLTGKLGYEGGAFPGGFHPGPGTVEVSFVSMPLTLEKHVGPSGRFRIPLSAGTYSVVGCGPSSSTTPSGDCSAPKTVTLTPGEVHHMRLVWARVP